MFTPLDTFLWEQLAPTASAAVMADQMIAMSCSKLKHEGGITLVPAIGMWGPRARYWSEQTVSKCTAVGCYQWISTCLMSSNVQNYRSDVMWREDGFITVLPGRELRLTLKYFAWWEVLTWAYRLYTHYQTASKTCSHLEITELQFSVLFFSKIKAQMGKDHRNRTSVNTHCQRWWPSRLHRRAGCGRRSIRGCTPC